MKRAGRILLAVLAGVAVWAVPWNLGTSGAQSAFPDVLAPGQPISDAGALAGLIAYSVLLSLLAGFVTAAAAGDRAKIAVYVLAALQLSLGIVAEISYWELMPVWYHLVFLALVAPTTICGGYLQWRGHRRVALSN